MIDNKILNKDNQNNILGGVQNLNDNQNINYLNQNKLNYSFSRYTKGIKTGLINLGDTSYINAVLFSLCNIRNIVSYFLNPNNQTIINNKIGEMPLSYVFERLVIHLYPYPEKNNNEPYKPIALFTLLGRLNNAYDTYERKNPNELICFILKTIHEEFISQNKNINQILNINRYNKNEVINNGIIIYQSTNISIISNNLNWFEIRESKCSICNNIMYSFLTFNNLELDISECLKSKDNNNKNEFLTLYDCLEYYISTKQRHLLCENCKRKTSILTISKIYSSPNIFLFLLNRGTDFDGKNNLLDIHFHIDDKINLNKYIENNNVPNKYELTGIISIYRKEKKYVCFCISPVDKLWYYYNDEIIKQTDIQNVINKHNNYDELIPCILFYKTINIQ